MFNILASIILVLSLGLLIVIFVRKQRLLKESLSNGGEEIERTFEEKFEALDERINKSLEFFLRNFRTMLLKWDNTVSNWLFSLKKNNHQDKESSFFIGEIIENGNGKNDEENKAEKKARQEKPEKDILEVEIEEEIILEKEK